MQDATPIIAIRNAIPATGHPSARACHPLSEGNDQKRWAPVDCSVIRTGGLGPINARTSIGRLMIPKMMRTGPNRHLQRADGFGRSQVLDSVPDGLSGRCEPPVFGAATLHWLGEEQFSR